ncbi:MAG TPA: lysine--tRNA ligase [Candidatus Limnocylindria bacterium]|nr:lysine--tRNA ligase [Candidatus Limnocylindria bacterium]
MFWADAEARLLSPGVPHVIRDSKTPSGAVPISGLRGPIITDALYRTFKAHGLRVRYVFTIDDYDPMDSQSMREQAGMAAHMGKPLCRIPSPDPGAATDYARYHAGRYLDLFNDLGIHPEEIHWMRDLYSSGALDRQIDLVLRSAETIRAIHQRIAGVEHPAGWLPLSVICERCGRIGTTLARDYDGKTVAYECLPAYVEWAEGCGHSGRISPFKGNAKLLWNEQWCADWDHFGVTYEEAGKDLLTAGGSRERSNAIYREVWRKEPPVGLMHEFLLIGGKKMSTSKGLGASAVDLVTVYPGELVRFLMIRTHPKRHIEFDPAGTALPRLVDEYDRAADAYIAEPASDLGRVWALSQLSEDVEPIPFRVRFSIVADWLQIPSIDPLAEAARRKGSALTEREERDLRRRIDLARAWLERWAPDDAKYGIAGTLPQLALSAEQKRYLSEVARIAFGAVDPEAMQAELYEAAKRVWDGRAPRDAFAALYSAFIGKPNGPRAGWLLVTLVRDDPEFVRKRLEEAAR